LNSPNNAATTPDSAALDITGDIDIKVFALANDWTPATQDRAMVSKYEVRQFSDYMQLNTNGTLRFGWSPTGLDGAIILVNSTVATGVTDGDTKWVRATLDVNDGAGNHVIKFYTSDDGTVWTQLGTTITTAGTTSIGNSTAHLVIGQRRLTGGGEWDGKIFRVIIQGAFDTVDNTTSVAFDADFAAQTADALAFTESSTNAAPVTINTIRYTIGIPNAGFTTVSTQTVLVNTDWFEPFTITAPTIVDLLAFEVTTAPASTATVYGAIYAATGDYQPTGGPVAVFGGVSVATGTTGVYYVQITPVTLQPGTYVLGFNSSVAFFARTMRRESALIHTLGANPVIQRTTRGRTYAAFPHPSDGWNTRAVSNVGRNTFAVLRWRPA
jgi:hypothetical protein